MRIKEQETRLTLQEHDDDDDDDDCRREEPNMHIHIRGKATSLHAWTGPEGSRTLRFQVFKTVGT